jgi:transposase
VDDRDVGPGAEDATKCVLSAKDVNAQARRSRRLSRFDEVKRLLAEGVSEREVARRTGRSRATIRKFARCETLPEIATRVDHGCNKVAAFSAYLRQRWSEGQRCASALHLEIGGMGFTGSRGSVQRFVQAWRDTPRCRSGGGSARGASGAAAAVITTPSPRSCAFHLIYPDHPCATLPLRDTVERLISNCPELATAQRQALEFVDMLRKRDASRLNQWLTDAESSDLPELRGFARSLSQDKAAVEAGLSLCWSNGPTEGQVNRLKFIKRSMYGRCNFDLLRARVLQRAGT